MNRMNLISRITAWTMVIAMLPWSSFVSGAEGYITPSNNKESYISKDENASLGDAENIYYIPEEENTEGEDQKIEEDEEDLILEDYVVSGRVVLDKDIEVKSVVLNAKSTLDLNGYSLICHGDIRLEKASKLIFNNGEIQCSGAFVADQPNCKIEMTSMNDRLVVDGRLDLVYGIFTFTNGTVEAKGDVNVTSYFNASGDNTFIFSGNGKQVLSQTEDSTFNKVILNNYSEYGIEVSNVFNCNTLQQNGCRMELAEQNGILGYTLTEDEEKDGLFILKTGTLDLNGHTLIINGDLIQAGGKVKINNGELIVNGNYRIQKRQVDGDKIKYSTSTGILEMTGEDDHIKVLNDFIVDSSGNSKGYLTDGTIEVLGNICIDNSKNLTGFYPTEKHSVIMSSDYAQTIEFKGKNKKSCSHLNNLVINNTSEEGVSFDAPAYISGSFDQGDSKVIGDLICVGDTEFVKGEYTGNISFPDISKITGNLNLTGKLTATNRLTVDGDISVSGDIINNGTMDIQGLLSTEGNYIESGNTYVSGTLNVSGNCETAKKDLRTFILTEGQVSVGKDVNNIVFSMESDKDYVSIGGNYSTSGNFKETYYKKGVMEIKGDVNAPAFKASGNHKLILSGDKLQTITNADQMTIGVLELNNKSEDGVFFDKVVSKSKLIRNDCRIRFGNLEGEFGWTLEDDQEISGDLILIDDELNLNGHNLHITGDLIQMSGTININGGELTVDGDYRMQSKSETSEGADQEAQSYGISTSSLIMSNENDKVVIKGDYYVWTSESSYGKLSDGILTLKGDLFISKYSNADALHGTGNFKLVLAGDNDQNLFLEEKIIYIPIFDIECTGKVISDGNVVVNKALESSYENDYEGLVFLNDSVNLSGDGFKGSLQQDNRYTDYVIDHKYHIGGDFYTSGRVTAKNGLDIDGTLHSYNSIDINGDSHIKGNLESSYEVKIDNNTTLSVDGNVDLGRNGYIVLSGKDSILNVKGDFTQNSTKRVSTGKIYVSGDFNSTGFSASGDNVVVLNGDEKQTMNVSKSCRFATVELDNSSEEGVVSKSVFSKEKFIKNDTKFSYEGIEGVSGYKLSKDEIVDGDFILLEDTMDLNGHTLTVRGDFIQLSGTVVINEGSLIISGDYRQEASKEADAIIPKTDYTKYQNYKCDAELIMQHEKDHVEIGGDLIINTTKGNYYNQTDGEIALKGNLIYFNDGYTYGFSPTKNLRLRLCGEQEQELRHYRIQYGTLYPDESLQLASLIIDTDDNEYVLKGSDISISNRLDSGNAGVESSVTLLQGSKLINEEYYGDLCINTSINEDHTIYGKVSGSAQISGKLEVNGSAAFDNLQIDHGELVVSEDLSFKRINMSSDSDSVTVKGNCNITGSSSNSSPLSAGTLIVGGDLNNSDKRFTATENCKIILNGTHKQVINCPYGNLGTVELQNHSSEGVYSDSIFKYEKLIKNGCKLTYGFDKATDGFVLDGDYTHTGNLVFIDGEIDLNGHTLTVEGDLVHVGGVIKLNGGKLVVRKDLREQSPNGEKYIEGHGTLSMTDEDDTVIVNGDCYLDSDKISEMKAGTLYVRGDLKRTIGYKNFNFGTKIILESLGDQSIDSNISGLSSAEFNTKGKLTLNNKTFYINKSVKSSCRDISGTIRVKSLNMIESPYYGDVVLNDSDSLSKDIDIIGTLSVDSRLNISGNSLSVSDLVICDEGYLIMNDSEDYISVSNDTTIEPLITYYKNNGKADSVLSDGIIELHGNFVCKRDKYFTASADHRVIFYPKKRKTGSIVKQNISFGDSADRTSRFNIVELRGDKDNYKFDNDPDTIANEIIYDSEEGIKLNPVTDLNVKTTTVSTVTITYTDTDTEVKAAGYEIFRNGVKVGVTDRTEYTDRNLKPFTQYSYTVAAFDENKNLSDESESISAQTLKDTDSPTVPNGLHITDRTGADISLAWTGSRDNIGVTGYILYRNGEPVGDKITGYEYIDKDVKQDEIYTYELSAIDAAGNESSKSDSVSAEIVMPTISRVIPADYKRIGGNSIELKAYYKNYGSGSRNSVDFEYLNANNEWVKINDAPVGQTQSSSSEYVSSCNWSIGHLESGSVNVRYTLTDSSGAKDEFITEYEIDHTAPDSPEDIEISDDNGVVVLTWKVSGESDLSKYNIYRYIINENDSKEVYTKIAEISDKFSARYEDNTLGLSDSAKYIVTAEDDLGNNSPLINPVSISVGNDEIPPAITEISPDVERIAGNTEITAYAKDNKAVSDISFYILSVEDKDNSKEWQLLDKITASIDNENRFYSTYTFDSTAYTDGDYYIAAKAEDHSGNISIEETYKRYEIDNSGITKININKTNAGSTYIQLMWDDVDDSDFECFQVEQKSGSEFEEVARIYDVTGCTVENLTPETNYTFRVCGVDALGNKGEYSDIISVSTLADTTAPSITAVYPVQGSVKDSIPLSMTVKDNYKVASGTWSLSFDGNEYETIYTAKGDKAKVNLSYKLNVSDSEKYPEGKIYIKSEAEDAFGNKSLKTSDGSDIVMEYIIDRTAPVMVKNVSASAHDGYIAITWDEGTEEDISRYKVYRADAEKNNYKCVMNEASLNFYDTSIEDGESYSYYVTALDEAGNESEKSNITYATAIPDETAPKVGGVSPLDGSKIGAEQKFQIIVTDNSNLSNVKTYYRANENDSWTLLNEMRTSGRSALLSFSADLKNEEEGDIFFKTICEDKNGNISDDFIYTCALDKTPPKAQLTAEGGNFEINISVKKDILESDISYCEIYRCELSNSSKNIDFFRNAQSIRKLSLETVNIDGTKQSVVRFTDTEVTPHTAYRYAAKVYDKVGNYSWTEISNATATSIDDKEPTIIAPDKITTIVGMEVGFDAGDSSDNVKIKSFAWDLGNGDKTTGARPKYRYNTSGKYNVKLTVTDAAGNSSEKDIEVQVKEASNNGICNLTVVDYQGNPIPYAYVYIKAGADSNTTFMTDAYGKISLCYKSGTYSVAAYKEGYLPEEQEYKITNMKTTEEILQLSSGEVVEGKFEVVRMSLQEIIDSGVDISDPANLNTFTFKTTLTFEKRPIPISVECIPGDILIDTSSDSGHEGGSTDPHFGDGKGKPDEVHVAAYVDQVRNDVPGVPYVPVIAVMSTTQTVSWLKTMYSANLTIMNKADSQYVINDAKGSIELPDGVSFAVLGDDKKRETGTSSGQTEVIDMGDIAGQEQKTVSWVLKGDKSGKYQIKARFDGLLSPFNVPLEKTFIAEQQMEVEQADVDIVVMPESAAYIGESYYIQYEITNKGDEPLYNFTTSIGDYKHVKNKTEVYIMDYDTQVITHSEVSMSGRSYTIPISEQMYYTPVLSGDDQITIPTLLPGQTIYGTWTYHAGLGDAIFTGDFQREYYELINSLVEVIEGENLGVNVFVKPIPAHVSKYISTVWKGEDEVIELGDPVDLTSGAFRDNYTALALIGRDTLSLDMQYDSLFAMKSEEISKNTSGYGWYNNFDSWIEEENGIVHYYMNPYVCIPFISENAKEGKLYGSVVDDSIEIMNGKTDEEIRFVSIYANTEGYSLVRHTDGTYTLEAPSGAQFIYDNLGRLSGYVSEEGSITSITYSDTENGYIESITEEISGNTLNLEKTKEGRILSVSDNAGRKSSFSYDENGNLIAITNPLGEKITYNYDDLHMMIHSSDNEGGLIVKNDYDEEGRVIKQLDSAGAELDFNYELQEDGGLKTIVKSIHDGITDTTTVISNNHGLITYGEDNNGSISYTYDKNDNIISVNNSNGASLNYSYNEDGYVTGISDSYGESVHLSYDENGNITGVSALNDSEKPELSKNAEYSYDDDNRLISGAIYGNSVNYSYDDNGLLTSIETEGRGSTCFATEKGKISSYTNEVGATVKFTYDSFGNINSVTDPLGGITNYTYDAMDRLISVENPNGGITSYTYNSLGLVTSETNPLGYTTFYSYDTAGRCIKAELPDKTEVNYSYDMLGRLNEKTFPDGTTEKYEHDARGKVTAIIYADGSKTEYGYGENGLLTEITDSLGNVTGYQYDGNGKVAKLISANGTETNVNYSGSDISGLSSGDIQTSVVYNDFGLVTSEIDPLGNVTEHEYDRFGSVVADIDPNGNRTEYGYDVIGRCTSVKYPNGLVINQNYDLNGNITDIYTTVDGKELKYSYYYDKAGLPVSFTDESGKTTTYSYDKAGQLVKAKDEFGNYTEYTYDCMGRLEKEEDSFGNSAQYQYDISGNLISSKVSVKSESDSEDASKDYSYTYDTLGRVISVTDPMGKVTGQTYDSLGRVTSVTDAKNGITEYLYDKNGNLVEEKNPLGLSIKYEYDEFNNLIKVTDGNGCETKYTYDKCGRVIELSDNEGVTKFTYDANSNLLTVNDKSGTISRTYDEMNRVTSCTDSKGNTVSYGYDELGNILSITYPGGEIVRYSYNPDGTLAEMSDDSGRKTIYGYDKQGRLTSTTRPDGSVETLEYDERSNVSIREDKSASGDILQKCEYTCDGYGNITSVKESVKPSYSLNYSSEAIGSECGSKNNDEYIITTSSMEYDAANRLISYNGQEVRYDNNGNMIYGPLDGEMTDFTYDSRNRLIQAGDNKYSYDAENIRISSECNGIKEVYVTNRISTLSQVLEINRIDSSNEFNNITKTTCYYGKGLVYDVTTSNTTKDIKDDNTEEIRIYHFDHLGSTRYITDETGKITLYFDYGTYGEFLGAHNSDGTECVLNSLYISVRFLYNGEYGVMTDDNGLLYMRQRYYNSTIKRFINQDILTGNITDSQSLNRYSYVEGDPINYMDPFGLSKLRNTLDSLTNNLNAITEFLAHPISNTGKFLGNVWSHMDTHTKLNVLGTLPVIGYVFDIANAISYFKEGKVAEGVESLIFALPTLNIAGGAGKIAQLLGKSKHSADIIGNTLQLCSTAAAAFTAACKTGTGIANIIDKYAVNGAPLDGQFLADVGEVASYGLMTTVFGRMTAKDYQSYSEAANTIVKGTVVNNEEIKWYTEQDYFDELKTKDKDISSLRDLMSPEEVARYDAYWNKGKTIPELGNGKQYSVMYEASVGKGKSRSAHRNAANKEFYNQMASDPDFKKAMDDYFGYDVMEYMKSGKSGLKNPSTEWVWHHPAKKGKRVVQLIPEKQHKAEVLQPVLHPLANGGGGFKLNYDD